ncbi:tetratricopeptide repeat protein 5, partial [Meleagris gallopavo]|uniref:tetratricopeptide repeat protein 5 n=1 Tax=Meleagris gallopavo TaxID=9103 RepID=UPI00093C8BEF
MLGIGAKSGRILGPNVGVFGFRSDPRCYRLVFVFCGGFFLAQIGLFFPQKQGKARGRRRRALSPSLLGALGDAVTPMAALWDGDNVGRALLGRVLGCALPEEGVPLAVGLTDGTGSVVLSVYNAAPGWGLAVGDAAAVGQPHIRRHHIQHQGKVGHRGGNWEGLGGTGRDWEGVMGHWG